VPLRMQTILNCPVAVASREVETREGKKKDNQEKKDPGKLEIQVFVVSRGNDCIFTADWDRLAEESDTAI